MALNKLKFNSLNVTPAASKGIGFNSSADGLEATFQGGDMRIIKKLTASSSSTLSFVDGSSDVVLDNTYSEYMFMLNNIHPSASGDDAWLAFQGSTNTGSSYGVNITSTYFVNYSNEDDDLQRAPQYRSQDNFHRNQETAFHRLTYQMSNDNQICGAGFLHLFNPSSTTFAKNFIIHTLVEGHTNYTHHSFITGYFNTTSAIDAIQFKMNSGNIDAGTITLYGIN